MERGQRVSLWLVMGIVWEKITLQTQRVLEEMHGQGGHLYKQGWNCDWYYPRQRQSFNKCLRCHSPPHKCCDLQHHHITMTWRLFECDSFWLRRLLFRIATRVLNLLITLYRLNSSEVTKTCIYIYIPLHWHDTVSWNPSSGKTRTYLFYMMGIMGAGVMATLGAGASATMILTMLNWTELIQIDYILFTTLQSGIYHQRHQ